MYKIIWFFLLLVGYDAYAQNISDVPTCGSSFTTNSLTLSFNIGGSFNDLYENDDLVLKAGVLQPHTKQTTRNVQPKGDINFRHFSGTNRIEIYGLNENEDHQIQMIDMNGRILFNKAAYATISTQVSLDNLPASVLILRVRSVQNSTSASYKFVNLK